jgi:hypothetical protein
MRNISDKTDNVGDALKADVFNSNKNELQHVVETGGVGLEFDPESGPDTDEYMLSKSIAAYSGGGEYYACSGTSPLYQLSRSTFKLPHSYFTGLQILFIATFTNTSAPQVQVGTLGNVDLKYPDGSDIPAGYIQNGSPIGALYVTDHFKLINFESNKAITTPRIGFHYTKSPGVAGELYDADLSPVAIPITETFNSISGATFASNLITIPRGYIYSFDITQAYNDGGAENNTRVYIAKSSSSSVPLLSDTCNALIAVHTTHIKGLIDFKAELTDPEIGLYIFTTTPGTWAESYAGLPINISIATVPQLEVYTQGIIIQTGY